MQLTLVYGAKVTQHDNAVALQQYLQRKLAAAAVEGKAGRKRSLSHEPEAAGEQGHSGERAGEARRRRSSMARG